jgi:ComF family protein
VLHLRGGWAEILQGGEAWLLPAACLGCGREVHTELEPLVCELCVARWRSVPLPICARCGEPRELNLSCRMCVHWPPDLGPARSAVLLDPPVRRLLHQFKYHGWRRLATSFADRMVPLVEGTAPDADLVPIPLSAGRLRQRGYNQAAELAHALARRTGRRVAEDRIGRQRETGTQTRLATAERRANLAEAFSANEGERPVVLVDDVFTTGATLVSAASALLDSGASRVEAVTFARAQPPLAGLARHLTRLK